MNPYEEPQSALAAPAKGTEHKQTTIKWQAIFLAGLIYFTLEAAVIAVLFMMVPARHGFSGSAEIVSFYAPWIVAAMFLAYRVKSRWITHGVIYSVIPPILMIVFDAVLTGRIGIVLLVTSPLLVLLSMILTLFTMTITRLVIAAIRFLT